MVFEGKFQSAVCIFSVLVFLAIGVACDDSADSEIVAQNIEDRLTLALEFSGGTVVEDGPPPYFEGDDYPQIEFVDPPQVEVALGDSFSLSLKTDFEFPEDITGAMIWVKNSNLRIDIEETVSLDSLIMILEARMLDDDDLKGRSFDAYVALYKGEETGLHETWRIDIPN